MKFGDKLIVLRKKNGMSQEELAEKLGVSRQSVSKWESNNTYPETDKIVQIANLFDCSMDDLINDKITDVEQSLRKNKGNIYEVWDSLLDFITRTVNMFAHMKFSTGLKCIIEMIVLSFILFLIGYTFCGITSSVVARLFDFIGNDISNIVKNILNGILNLLWFILSLIVLVHAFKIRYLNYYDNDKKEERNNNNKETIINTKEKVIIRDDKEKPFAFLGVFSKIIMFFLKSIVLLVAIHIILITIALLVGTVISISLATANVLFVGSTLSLISSVALLILVLLLCFCFILNKEVPVKPFLITLVASIIICGIGLGISIISLKNIEIVDNKDLKEQQLKVDYKDDLVIKSNDLNKYNYIIDNNLEENTIIVKSDINYKIKKLIVNNTTEDKLNISNITSDFTLSNKEYAKLLLKDLKKNKIKKSMFNTNIDNLTIVGNQNTINKLINNIEKLYLIEKVNNDNKIEVTIHESKVHFPNGFRGEYNAITNELIYDSTVEDNYKCKKSINSTKYGDKIIIECGIEEDYQE